jgi:hypothetical protein
MASFFGANLMEAGLGAVAAGAADYYTAAEGTFESIMDIELLKLGGVQAGAMLVAYPLVEWAKTNILTAGGFLNADTLNLLDTFGNPAAAGALYTLVTSVAPLGFADGRPFTTRLLYSTGAAFIGNYAAKIIRPILAPPVTA